MTSDRQGETNQEYNERIKREGASPKNYRRVEHTKPQIKYIKTNDLNTFKHTIAVMSGKGGVGKSTISAGLAYKLQEKGYKVGIMDGDIIGPSIPRLLACENQDMLMTELGLVPYRMENGLKVASINLMLDSEATPIIWRGPVIASTINQFYQDVIWEDLDYLIIDMPPGTSDVSLTVMQTIKLDGIIMVTLPQDMVSMIVSKALSMAQKLNVKCLGLVKNMSFLQCPHCNEKISLFTNTEEDKFLSAFNLDILAELPMQPNFSSCKNMPQQVEEEFEGLVKKILKKTYNIDKGILN